MTHAEDYLGDGYFVQVFGEEIDYDFKNFDLKAVNPNARAEEITRTPDELLDLIEGKGREVADAIAKLRGMT